MDVYFMISLTLLTFRRDTVLGAQTWDWGSVICVPVGGSVTSVWAYKHTMLVSNKWLRINAHIVSITGHGLDMQGFPRQQTMPLKSI